MAYGSLLTNRIYSNQSGGGENWRRKHVAYHDVLPVTDVVVKVDVHNPAPSQPSTTIEGTEWVGFHSLSTVIV